MEISLYFADIVVVARGGTWGLVGGNIDAGEHSIQAAIREVREEISHEVSQEDLEFIKSYNWKHDDAHISFDAFKCKTTQHDINIELDTDENTEYMWISPKDLHSQKDLMAGLYPILKDLYKL